MTTYSLSSDADDDWQNIVDYTLLNFGVNQVRKYTQELVVCLDQLANEQGQFKNIEVAKHVILVKHCQQHYIFALKNDDKTLVVIAILHEKMDLMQRLKDRLS